MAISIYISKALSAQFSLLPDSYPGKQKGKDRFNFSSAFDAETI